MSVLGGGGFECGGRSGVERKCLWGGSDVISIRFDSIDWHDDEFCLSL